MNRLVSALLLIYVVCIVIALVFVTNILGGSRPAPPDMGGPIIDINAATIP